VPRPPLIRLGGEGPGDLYLKLENLRPIPSFKLRGASNAMALLDDAQLAAGVYTASAGNMAWPR
jgi:threonine dehydratase